MILKHYNNNIKSNKSAHINIGKEFENDNYLIQTLKRTTKFQNDEKLPKYENSLQDLLSHINKTIKFRNNPKIKRIHEENDEFLKPYKYLSETFEAQTEQVLKDLIIKYTQRGYRIPKFSYKNNIFKINALIEENSEKLKLMLIEDLKKKENIIGPKTMMYLNKLNYLVKILITKDQNLVKKYSKLLNKKEGYIKKESIEKIKKDIEQLINLTKGLKLNKIGNQTAKRKSSYLTKMPQLNSFKISNSKNSSKDDLTPIKNNNINNNIIKTEESGKKERNHVSFLSMRINNFGIQTNKLLNSIKAKNKMLSFEKKVRNNTEGGDKQKNIFLKKSKPLINLKMKSFLTKDKNERIKTANQREKEKEKIFFSYSRKDTVSSDIVQYMKQTNNNKNYQSEKNNYFLGLKKASGKIKQKLSNKSLGYSFDSSKNKGYFSKKQSKEIKNISRNIEFQSELKKIRNELSEKLEERKSKFLWNAYKKIRKGKYESVENIMHQYLKEIKELNSKDENMIMDYYNYKNLKNNLLELNMKVNEDNTRKKVEKIYSNIHILKRITPTLNNMKEKENNLDRLEKIFSSGVNKYN